MKAIRLQDTDFYKRQKAAHEGKKPKKTWEQLNSQEKDELLKALAIKAGLVQVS